MEEAEAAAAAAAAADNISEVVEAGLEFSSVFPMRRTGGGGGRELEAAEEEGGEDEGERRGEPGKGRDLVRA